MNRSNAQVVSLSGVPKKFVKSDMFSSILIVAVLLGIMLTLKSNYLSPVNIYTLAKVMAVTALVGFCQMIVIGTNGLNLSIGPTGALSAVIAGWAMTIAGLPWGLCLLFGMGVAIACGVI
ncbi:MAG: hypothetical protein WCP73_07060, partial [Eubacteriales bacterium]